MSPRTATISRRQFTRILYQLPKYLRSVRCAGKLILFPFFQINIISIFSLIVYSIHCVEEKTRRQKFIKKLNFSNYLFSGLMAEFCSCICQSGHETGNKLLSLSYCLLFARQGKIATIKLKYLEL